MSAHELLLVLLVAMLMLMGMAPLAYKQAARELAGRKRMDRLEARVKVLEDFD